MSKKILTVLVVCLLGAAVTPAVAQDDSATAGMEMPPMGPPDELAECGWMVGTWTGNSQMRMGPDEEWMESPSTITYSTMLDGGAIWMEYESPPMMGMPMPFKGVGIQTYDRMANEWQMTWTDNMSCRTSIYTGTSSENETVMEGKELYQGMEVLTKITTYNESPESFDWKMENSYDGGETWFVSGKAHYEKK